MAMLIDKTFAQYLSEIEKSYLALPKAARIRVERWVEKLVTTGNNPIWKKHRNEYAKLLLNMVISKNLESPFNSMPPHGSLAPLNSQQRVYQRNLLGAHETSFWRDLYKQFDDVAKEDLDDSRREFSFEKPIGDDVSLAMQSKHGSNHYKVGASTTSNQVALSREVQNLNLLIREQSQRIKLLEQQLHDERTQHELQLQRLNYCHRVETNNFKTQIDQFAMEMSVQALSPSRKETRSFLSDSMNHPDSKKIPSPIRTSKSAQGFTTSSALKPSSSTLLPPSHSYRSPHKVVSTGGSASISDCLNKRGLLSFMEQKQSVTATLNNLDSVDANVFDLTPRAKSPNQQRILQHRINHYRFPGEDEYAPSPDNTAGASDMQGDSRFDDSELDSSLRWGDNKNHYHHEPLLLHPQVQFRRTDWETEAEAEDDAFLAHLDRFQSEIKKINTNITLTSPERF